MDSVNLYDMFYSPYSCSPYSYSPYSYFPHSYSPYSYYPGSYSPYSYSLGSYSPYSPYTYYSDELGTIVNKRYGSDNKTQNIDISPITFNNMNCDTYNFKVDDRKLNTLLEEYYPQYFDYIMKHINDVNLPNDFYDTLIDQTKHNLIQPYNTYQDIDRTKLFFSIDHRSNVFSNYMPMAEKTEFVLEELKDINDKDYAFVTLFFPGYDTKMNKHYSYLIGTLLVAYMLKTCPQNYALKTKGINCTKAKVLCMVTPDVEQYIIDLLKLYYDDVIIAPYISWSETALPKDITQNPKDYIKINDVSKGNLNPFHAYSKVFTKLNIFDSKLLPYKKVILLDTDLFSLGYFDTLFSIDTPAGCLEHRRLQINELGVTSWGFDRSQFAKHGKVIPKNLTDIENIFASDINASLLIIEPNRTTFDNMIKQLQTPLDQWFGEHKEHKGFWLGNNFYDFYFLPEQNYITKRFSGEWKSVDLGFSTWLIDIENSFGFTFAGFVVKPWEVQSAFHKYSINPYSQFSKINNKISQKSYGCQLMNEQLCKMLDNIKQSNIQMFNIVKKNININFVMKPFDPWEPEYDIRNSKYYKNMNDLTNDDLKFLSYDQKKLVYLLNNNIDKPTLSKILYFDQILDNFTRNIYNIHFTSLSYHLANIVFNIMDKYKCKLYPFGNTFVSISRYNSFDITDDDNDFIMVTNKKTYRQTILDIMKTVLDNNLQIYVSTYKQTEFIQILKDDVKQLYYYKDKTNKMTYSEFKNTFDFNNFKYFNVSYCSPEIEKIMNDLNISATYDMYNIFKKNSCIKVPWIDIFLLFEECSGPEEDNKMLVYEGNSKFIFEANSERLVKFRRDVFDNKAILGCMAEKKKLNIINRWIRIQNADKYVNEYYGDGAKLNRFIIKSRHVASKGTNTRKIIFDLNVTDKINNDIIKDLFNYINMSIEQIYKSVDINKYLNLV